MLEARRAGMPHAVAEHLVLHTVICSFAEQNAAATSSDGAPRRGRSPRTCPFEFLKTPLRWWLVG
jgi:hypothetical protein